MLIPVTRFKRIPDGCPVQVVRINPATLLDPSLLAEDECPHHAVVDLSTDAAVRAFAPELIAAVRGLPDYFRPLKEPYPLWDKEMDAWILTDYIGDASDEWHAIAYEPTRKEITGDTPTECSLAGLQTVLEVTKDAQ